MVAELHSAYVNYRMPPLDAVLSRRRSNRISSRHLEWDFLHVRALQCTARFFPVADAALLAAADDAPRQISSRPAPEVRRRSADSRWPRRKTRNLGSPPLARRAGGLQRRAPPARGSGKANPELGGQWFGVGEVVASSAVVRLLREKFPSHRILISTTTSTGQKLAARQFGAENVFYFPLDFAFAVRPYLGASHPELVVVAETEFWPNFLRLAKRSGARISVINRSEERRVGKECRSR